MRIILAGATSQTIYIEVLDSTSTTGGRKTGLAYNTASLTAYYARTAGSATSITLATLAAANSAYSSGGFKEVDATNMPGIYRLDLPDAAVAAGVPSVVVTLKGATGMVQVSVEVQLTAVNLQDTVRGGMTALPNAAAEAAGGLYTRGTGAGQINQPANGRVDVNTIAVSGTTQTARDIGASVLLSSGTGTGQLDFTSGVVKANLAQILGTALTETAGQIAAAFKQFFDVASPTGTMKAITAVTTVTTTTNLTNAPTAGDFTATMKTSLNAATPAVTVSDKTGFSLTATTGLGNQTANITGNLSGSVGSVTAGVTVTTNNDKTGYGLSAAAVQAVWDALTSALTTVGSIGKKLADWTIGTAQTGDSFARLGAPAGASVSADIAAVKAETASIQSYTNDIQTRLPAALVSGRMDASVGAYQSGLTPLQPTVAGRTLDVTATGEAGVDFDNTAGTLAKGTDLTGFNDLDAAGVRSAVGLASANLDTQLTAIDDYLDTEVAAIKAKTDNLPAAPAAVGDIPTAAANADAVWDEAIAGHLGAGSTGNALNAAGSAGDPWSTPIPGAYGAGTAGKILGDNVNATISSRSSHSAADVWAAVTRTLTAASDSSGVTTLLSRIASALTITGGAVDVNDKTGFALTAAYDPAKTAAQAGDSMALTSGERNSTADALLDRTAGVETGWTLRQAARVMLAALAGKLSGAATTTVTVRDVGDTKARITATVDADGNRTAVTTDAT